MKVAGSDGAAPIGDELHVGRGVGRGLLSERFLPLTPLDGIGGWRHGLVELEVVREFGIRDGFWNCGEGVDHGLGLDVVATGFCGCPSADAAAAKTNLSLFVDHAFT